MTTWNIIEGDCREVLKTFPERTAHTCITSPPYFGLRDYGHAGQIGLESTPSEYVTMLVDVFREVRRALRDDGTVWLNLGDGYNNTASGANGTQSTTITGGCYDRMGGRRTHLPAPDLKPKDLLGIPWMVAFALRADGWYLRSEIIWHKPNPMPESVTDRPTKSHEQIFLLSKGPRYFYDSDAIREAHGSEWIGRPPVADLKLNADRNDGGARATTGDPAGRNKRSVWTVATQPYAGAHFATFPPKLIEPCVLAGCPVGGTVLDPFAGAATTGVVTLRHGRSFVGIELSASYAELARRRIYDDAPLFNVMSEC